MNTEVGIRKSEKEIEKSDPSSSDRAGLCRGKHAEGGRWKAEFGMRKWEKKDGEKVGILKSEVGMGKGERKEVEKLGRCEGRRGRR
jgi:hypothetical protein